MASKCEDYLKQIESNTDGLESRLTTVNSNLTSLKSSNETKFNELKEAINNMSVDIDISSLVNINSSIKDSIDFSNTKLDALVSNQNISIDKLNSIALNTNDSKELLIDIYNRLVDIKSNSELIANSSNVNSSILAELRKITNLLGV